MRFYASEMLALAPIEVEPILKAFLLRWYLEHVYPESQMPLDYFFLGEMRNDASHNCLDTMGRKSGEEVK